MISSTFLPQTGGVEIQLRGLSAALRRAGCPIEILTRHLGVGPLNEEVEGVPVHRLRPLQFGRAAASLAFVARGLLWLMRRRSRFEIFHCHQAYSATTLGVLAKRLLAGVRVVVKPSTSGLLSEMAAVTRGLPLAFLRRSLLRDVDAFVAITSEIAGEIEAAGIPGVRIARIPNGVELPDSAALSPEARAEARRKLGIDWKEVVVYVGRLSSEKGLLVLLEAWKRVSEKRPAAGLLLVGDGGPVRNVEMEIRARARSLGLDRSVHFAGHLGDVRPALAAAQIFVLPSFSEGMSNALLEALAFARPAVATDLSGNREIVAPDAGLLVPPGSAEPLADALRQLLSSPERAEAMGARARQIIARDFSFPRVAERYRELYQTLLQGRAPASLNRAVRDDELTAASSTSELGDVGPQPSSAQVSAGYNR
jgi:glycosyltransferase involved in cell wall biosynthesis